MISASTGDAASDPVPESTDKELKPCPFCGGSDIKIYHQTSMRRTRKQRQDNDKTPNSVGYIVFCVPCSKGVPHIKIRSVAREKRVAIEAWNQRTPSPDMDRVREVLRDMLPSNLSTENRNIRDDMAIPLETTMGDLRKIKALLTELSGDRHG